MLGPFDVIISLYTSRKVLVCVVARRYGLLFAFNSRPLPLYLPVSKERESAREMRGNRLSNDDVERVFTYQMATCVLSDERGCAAAQIKRPNTARLRIVCLIAHFRHQNKRVGLTCYKQASSC